MIKNKINISHSQSLLSQGRIGNKQTRKYIIRFIFFFLLFVIYISSYNVTSYDSRWTVFTAYSIIIEGNTDLNEFNDVLKKNNFYEVDTVNGKYYSYFPIGPVLVAVPFVYTINKTMPVLFDWFPFLKNIVIERTREPIDNFDILNLYRGVEFIIACFLTTITGFFFFLFSGIYLDEFKSFLLTLLFSLGTTVFSVASRGLWQHTPSILFLAISLYLIVKSDSKPKYIIYAALPLFLSFWMRPTNIIPVIIFSVYILFYKRKYFLKYMSAGIFICIPFFIFDYSVYNQLFQPYFTGRIQFGIYSVEAFLANLISPARGIFFFSPFLIFMIYGIIKALKKQNPGLDIFILAIIIFHIMIISGFPQWWGGHSFGPRLMTDIIPFMMYFLVPYFADNFNFKKNNRLISLNLINSIFLFLCLISIYIHFVGANRRETWVDWNKYPDNIDINPSRVWDLKDIQFFR